MSHLDRLSSLITHFEISASQPQELSESNLLVTGDTRGPTGLVLYINGSETSCASQNVLQHLKVEMGGDANPLLQALPARLHVDLETRPEIRSIVQMILRETEKPRCGGRFALDRLCELLVVSLLRQRIEELRDEPGMFAGLSHPRLSPVMVAMHDNPGQNWQLDDFLPLAGMSRSQFVVEFQATVGSTPIAYLKQWRMVLARIAILRGDRVNEVARKFGYASGDAFCRAFVKTYGMAPTRMRSRASANIDPFVTMAE